MSSPVQVSVRPFRPADLDPLVRLIRDTIEESYGAVYPPRAVEFFKGFHSEQKILERSRRGSILVVEEEGVLTATGALVDGEIFGVFVHPQHQHGGRGKALMRALEDEARARGVKHAELSVSLPSVRFYQSLGYRMVEERSRDLDDGQRLEFWKAAKRLVPLVVLLFSLAVSAGPTAALDTANHEMKRFFISGHSLMDSPVGRYLARISQSARKPVAWDQQIIIGSTLAFRNRSAGKDKRGFKTSRIPDVFQKLARRKTPFDTLIVTEASGSLAPVIWNNTVRHLRFMHDRFIESNAAGRTYFYESWTTIRDRSDLSSWIAIERGGSALWGCVATRINASLEREGRADRITPLPTGWGLAELVDAITGGRLPPFEADTPTTLERFFKDDIHLKPIGRYYIALLSYVGVTGRSPVGLWHPAEVSKAHAAVLQQFAVDFFKNAFGTRTERNLPECRAWVESRFCDQWNAYMSRPQRRCHGYFGRTTFALDGFETPNPLVLPAPEVDADYWYSEAD